MAYRGQGSRRSASGRPGGRPGYIFYTTHCPYCDGDFGNNIANRHIKECAKLEPLERVARTKLREKRRKKS